MGIYKETRIEKRNRMKDKIKKLVERDTPMKVINGITVYGVCFEYECPNCKQEIDTSGYYPDQYYLIKYCISCGQRLDWSDEK